jgi:hypothetical protein
LHDHRTFGEPLAGIELQHGHLTLGIDLPEISAGLGLLLFVVDLLQFEIRSGLPQHDMGCERTGPGREVKLHR